MCTLIFRFPDDKVGQFPMAYVVRKAGSNLSETAVMDFVAKQVCVNLFPCQVFALTLTGNGRTFFYNIEELN